MFDAEQIQQAVSKALSQDMTIPDGHKAALVTFINNDKAEFAFAYKLSDHWDVQLLGSHTWTGDNSVGAVSKITW